MHINFLAFFVDNTVLRVYSYGTIDRTGRDEQRLWRFDFVRFFAGFCSHECGFWANI